MARTWKGPNGLVSYTTPEDGILARAIWVNGVDQPIQLAVNKQQSRKYSMIYPRGYAPGNISVNGQCQDQTKYHELALFFRKHQIAIVNSPVTDRFARLSSGNTSGFRRLLQLSIPSEGILVRGWVDSFSVVNRGVFDPAPEYTFNFFVVFDSMSEDIGISHVIKDVYNQDDNVYANRKKRALSPIDSAEPGHRDFPGDFAPIRPDDRAERFTP